MEAAARSNVKDVTLEMGGKSPVIIFADANLAKAAKLAMESITISKSKAQCVTRRHVEKEID